MKIVVSEKSLHDADNCQNNYSCLNGDRDSLCPVTRNINDKVHFINCLNHSCMYQMAFGLAYICTCPVRKEIYNKYRM